MKHIKLKLTLMIAVAFLSGCNTFSGITGVGTDNTPPPTKLENLSSTLQPHIVQSFSLHNKVYAHTENEGKLYNATHKGVVEQVDMQSGKLVWQKDLDEPLVSSIGASNNIVILGSETGNIYALNSQNGKTLWKISLKSQLGSAPAFMQDRIVFKTLDGKLIALNSSNGQIRWQVEHGSPLMVLSHGSTPKIYGDKVIVGFSDGKLSAYSLTNGRLIWENQIAQPSGATDVEQMIDIASTLQIENGVVYTAAYQGNLAAVGLNSGQILWQTPVSAYDGLILTNGAIILTDAQSALIKVNPHNGAVILTQNALKFRGLTTPLVIGNDIVVGDKESYLHYLDASTGKILSRINIDEGEIIDLYARNNGIYVLTKSGIVKKVQL